MIKIKTLNTYKPIDVNSCRSKKNYTYREYLLRFIWNLLNPFFSLSPRKCFFLEELHVESFWSKNRKKCTYISKRKDFLFHGISALEIILQ